MKKFTLLSALMLLISYTSNAQCVASYSYTDNGSGLFTFTDASGMPATTDFYWDFGDGNSGYGTPVTNQYAVDGAYGICLTIIDSVAMCSDTYCDSIWVTGTGGSSSCTADFTSSVSGNTASFTNNSTSSGSLSYAWDFGDGNTSSAANPTYTYANAGTYVVCLLVWDGQGCTDTLCDPITIAGGPSCQANFWWFQDSSQTANPVLYAVDMSTPSSGLSYTWDFGDGNSSTAQYPTHTYAQVGAYNLCLTIDDGFGCTDTYCDSIYVFIKANGFTLNVINQASVGVEEPVATATMTNMYPNPAEAITTIEINATENAGIELTITDLTGRLLLSSNQNIAIGANKININTSNLPTGLYLVNLRDESGNDLQSLRLMKK